MNKELNSILIAGVVAAANLSDAKMDTQLIYSPAYPDLESCKAANAAVSKLLGANVSISAGTSSRHASISKASTTYSSSECLPSLGP